jgi:hypothetical protein
LCSHKYVFLKHWWVKSKPLLSWHLCNPIRKLATLYTCCTRYISEKASLHLENRPAKYERVPVVEVTSQATAPFKFVEEGKLKFKDRKYTKY